MRKIDNFMNLIILIILIVIVFKPDPDNKDIIFVILGTCSLIYSMLEQKIERIENKIDNLTKEE